MKNWNQSLASRMHGVESSPTLKLNAIAQDLIKSGKDVINFTAGELDFDTPTNISDAAIQALKSGKTRYTAPHGIIELREAIAVWLKRDFGLSYSVKQTTVTCGAKQGIFNLILATIQEGDEVLIPSPFWVSYPEMVRIAGGTPILVPPNEAGGLNLDEVKKNLNTRTKMILLNFPNNPSGVMVPEKSLQELATLLEPTNVIVASDEIYSSLIYSGQEFTSFASISEDAKSRTITFNGLSKSHAMTGWRVGFAAGPEVFIEAMGVLQAQSSTHITSFVQYAAIEALKQTKADFAPRLQQMLERRDLMVAKMKEIPHVGFYPPEGAFYIFPELSYYIRKLGGGSVALAEYLIKEAGIVVVPGKPFGDDTRLRLSFAKDKKSIEEGMRRLSAALQKI